MGQGGRKHSETQIGFYKQRRGRTKHMERLENKKC